MYYVIKGPPENPNMRTCVSVCQDKSVLLHMWRQIPQISAKSRCVNVSMGVCRAETTTYSHTTNDWQVQQHRWWDVSKHLSSSCLLLCLSRRQMKPGREVPFDPSMTLECLLALQRLLLLLFFPLDAWRKTNNGDFQNVPGPKINFWTQTMCPWRRKGLCVCVCVFVVCVKVFEDAGTHQ